MLVAAVAVASFAAVAEQRVAASGTRPSERAVAAALNWFTRHQNEDGSWHFDCSSQCKDKSCTHAGTLNDNTSATALGLLTYLGVGTADQLRPPPAPRGPYTRTVKRGFAWLVNDMRKDDGTPEAVKTHSMTARALAAICFCEAFAAAGNEELGAAARSAIKSIGDYQNSDGGWADKPGDPSNLVVFGWQITALKSAQLANVPIEQNVLTRAKEFIQGLSTGEHGGLFASDPDEKASPWATAIGMLALRYFGAKSDDPAVAESRAFLMDNLPAADKPDPVYWFFGTQAMHLDPGPQWGTWNQQIRRVLKELQTKESCAVGSWFIAAPRQISLDAEGGRLANTALSALTLEVYYRYLRIFRLDAPVRAATEQK